MFIELMEVMESCLLCEDNSSILGNLIGPGIPIGLCHILTDMIRHNDISNTLHQLPGKSIIIIICNEIHDIFGLPDILSVHFLAIILLIHEAHIGSGEIGLHDRVVVVVLGEQGFVQVEL
jgi:hypothetical protein